MPELPEVETIRKTLAKFVLGKEIKDIDVLWPKIIKQPDDIEQFRHLLIRQTFQRIDRKGKFLLFYMDDVVMVSHLRMEGKYRVVEKEIPVDKHTHVIFHLTNEQDLRYNDVRKFGTMHVFPIGKELIGKPLKQLGPDPFEENYSFDYVYEKLQRTSRNIKAALLDQTIIAGLGNIYVDETLFLAQVHPEKRANTLSKQEAKRIYQYTEKILSEAVEQGGTTIRSYVNGEGEMGMFQQKLYVYGQEETACRYCGEIIVKLKVAGRGTHICPSCQPKI